MAFFLLFKVIFELREKLGDRDGGRRSGGGGDGGKFYLIFEFEEGRKTTNRGGVAIEGTVRRLTVKILKVEIDFSGSDLLEKWILRHEIRLGGEPGEETVEIGDIVFDGYLGEGLVFEFTRFEKETTKVV